MDSALLAFFETGCASPSTASVPEVVSTLRFVCGRYISSAITAPFAPYPSIGVLCFSRHHAALLSVACMRTLRYKMALLRLAAHHDIFCVCDCVCCCTSATLKVNSKLTSTRTSPRTITTLTWMVLSKRPSQVTFCRRSPSRRARRRSWETYHHGVNSGVIQIGSHQLHVHAWASMNDESDESCHLYE